MKKVLILGCTGSIGTSTIDIIRNTPEDFKICGLQCHSNKEKLEQLAAEFHCPSLLTKNNNQPENYQKLIDESKPDIVVNGIAGTSGLLPSKIVLENGIDIALANKETIVMAGNLIKALAAQKKATLLPVDSEHSAIFCLINQIKKENLKKIIITASGGPFRNFTKEELENVTVEMALKHPTWKMGPKITVDSSTLANKGLEVIEAAYLFDLDVTQIDVTVHPQSLVHSIVQTKDGMMYAQVSEPDMKHPIINALNWPNNKQTFMPDFDIFDRTMTFMKPNYENFPLLSYAFNCVKNGNAYPIAFNAANEVAVAEFLNKKISFTAIANSVEKILQDDWSCKITSFEDVFEQDKLARRKTKDLLGIN